MKPMKFKNDLEMWHKFAEVAEQMRFVAKTKERELIFRCAYFDWDGEASEEYCYCPHIHREKDFVAEEECWKCPYYEMRSEPK